MFIIHELFSFLYDNADMMFNIFKKYNILHFFQKMKKEKSPVLLFSRHAVSP